MTRLTSIALALAAGLATTPALAGELGDHCAWGLVNGKKVKTDCAVTQMGPDGKTYCFSNEQVKWEFIGNLEANVKKANENFKK